MTYRIEYEIPPMRAILYAQKDAVSEDAAVAKFKEDKKTLVVRIRKVTQVASLPRPS